MPKLSDLKPLSNHELIAQIKNRSSGNFDQANPLELGLLKVELTKRAKPIKSPFSKSSVGPGTNDLQGSDLTAYETDPSLRLNATDAKVLAAHMHLLSFTDQFTVNGALSLAIGYTEARDLRNANEAKDWKLRVKMLAQNLLVFALIVAAVSLYQWYKKGH
jgi:hypothetical protein